MIPQISKSNSSIPKNVFVAPTIRAIAQREMKIIGQTMLVPNGSIIQPSRPVPPKYQGAKRVMPTKLKIPATTPRSPPTAAERNPIFSNLTIVFQ
jgi:hypothetical protein